MYLSRRVRLQLAIFAVITLVAGGVMAFGLLGVPNLWFGVGHYRVTVDLPAAAGLYKNANVTYRGTEVGRVDDVHLTDSGVAVAMSLESGIDIPADLKAEVHSQNAVGEQFVDLIPQSADGPVLRDGDVIPVDRAVVPPNLNALLSAANTGLLAIPHDNLQTVINEAYTGVGGLGPEISRLVKGTTTLTADARENLDALTNVVDNSKPILDSQIDTSDSIQAWAANLAQISGELRDQDPAVRGVLQNGPGATDEVRALLDRVQPTLPVLLANLVSIGQVAITYHANIEQELVLPACADSWPPRIEFGQPRYQGGVSGHVSVVQPERERAATVHHRLFARQPDSPAQRSRLPRPPSGRPVLPGAAGLAAQCPGRAKSAL